MTLNWRNNKFVCGLRAELTSRRRRRLQNGKVICREWCAMTVNPRSAWRHTFTVDGPCTEAAAIGGARAFTYIICFPRTEPNNAVRRVLCEYHSRCGRRTPSVFYSISPNNIQYIISPIPVLCSHCGKTTRRPGNESFFFFVWTKTVSVRQWRRRYR